MMGDDFDPRAPPVLAPLPGCALCLEPAELVGLGGGGVLEVDVDVAAMRPAPPLPAAVRGIGMGVLVSSATF